jgi:hypothetical protein
MNNRDEFPNLSFSGNRAINEIEWQINHNPNLRKSERAWFGALLRLMCDEFMSYEEAIQSEKMTSVRNPSFGGDMIGSWDD